MSDLESDFLAIRKRFPLLHRRVHNHPLIYLDSAATAQKPASVISTITDFYKNGYATVHRAVYSTSLEASEVYEEVRRKVASFLNASAFEEIVFTKGATDAINLIATSFGKAFIDPKDTIILTEMEHHSNIVPWQLCAEARGATIKVIPFRDDGQLDLEVYKRYLKEGAKIVAVAHISNTLGIINPIKEIIDLAHAHGAKVLVDGAQSAPHMPIDVQSLDCDFFVFSGHKTFGPTGIGILYGKRQLLDALPPYQGGGDMIETVTFEKTTYNSLPLKFEAGTPPIAEVIGLGAALDFLQEVGMSRIQEWEEQLVDTLWKAIHAIDGVKILGGKANRSAMISFTIEGVHPLDVATLLDLQGVAIRSGHLCAQPVMRHFGIEGALRASLALYNTKDEIHNFAKALTLVLSQLRLAQ
jgi:cysteine desulfurase/selenocysteine lyase